MKKLIKSIVAFFFGNRIPVKEEIKDTSCHQSIEEYEDHLTEREQWDRMPAGTFYKIDHILYGFQSYELNLISASRKYPVLKKSTLYNAFKGGKTPRTYERENYKVTECQKF